LSVAAILDIDGTLVDTNYHHAIAWHRALQRHGCTVPLWRLHRHIGMGGDQLVASVAGEDFEREHGDAARDAEKEEYEKLIDEAVPLPEARELIGDLRDRGCRVVLASSAKQHEVEHYVGLLGGEDLPTTASGDVEQTKPEPDLVEAALEKVGGTPAIMIGDSVWDCEAAKRAGLRCFGVLTGGFSREELLEAGAEEVYTSLGDLRADLENILAAD
jgi:HAD superfamily hydrolase (TIGR01549 family)